MQAAAGMPCGDTGGPHHQGPGAVDAGVDFIKAGGVGKHLGPEEPGGAVGDMPPDGEQVGKG